MAKQGDQPSIKVEPRPTVGRHNGFLADEERLDRRALLRLGTWGVVSVGAVILAVLANQSSMKLRRNEATAADLARQSQQIQSLTRESQNETRRLAAAIDTLDNDRDRLFARVTVLEQGLDSVTGSIAKQTVIEKQTAVEKQTVAKAAPPAAPAVAAIPSPQPAAPNPAPTPPPAPVAAPTATTEPAVPPSMPEKPVANAKPAELPVKPAAAESSREPSLAEPPGPPHPVASAASLPPAAPVLAAAEASKSMIGPPSPAAQKPPAKTAAAAAPQRVASAAAEENRTPGPVQPASPAIAVKRTEFGVDLGGANSVPGLRARWRGLLKTRANAPLTALQPIIVIREGSNGLGMQLRLVAGPFDDAAAAARICAGMAERERPCETTVYDGQRLTMKPGDEPAVATIDPARSESAKSEAARPEVAGSEVEKAATEKPARRYYPHRHFYPGRPLPPPPPPVAQEPPKPEPTTFSSFFSRHTQAQPAGNGP